MIKAISDQKEKEKFFRWFSEIAITPTQGSNWECNDGGRIKQYFCRLIEEGNKYTKNMPWLEKTLAKDILVAAKQAFRMREKNIELDGKNAKLNNQIAEIRSIIKQGGG